MQYVTGKSGSVLFGILDRESSRVWADGAQDGWTWLRVVARERRALREKMAELGIKEGRIYASSLHDGKCLEIIHDTTPPTRQRFADLDLARVRP